MSITAAGTVRRADGRRLAYTEYGDARGAPVFYFHGLPGSRLDARFADPAAARLGVRVIALDRPGFGGSDFQPGRRILDWPGDVRTVADALRIERFAVLGVSGGAPYAVACAHALPQRLTAAGVVAGMAPIAHVDSLAGMARLFRLALAVSRRAPRLVPALCGALVHGLRMLSGRVHLARAGCAADRAALARVEVELALSESFREAIRAGIAGIAHDLLLHGRSWGFPLDTIRAPVHVWHGEADLTVPARVGRALARAIPASQAHFYPDEGHYSLPINRMDEILAALLAASRVFAIDSRTRGERAAPRR